jgi:hypothetical protein
MEHELQELQDSQDDIGWDNFMSGNISVMWQEIQAQYFQEIGKQNSGLRWTSALIQKIWQVAWDQSELLIPQVRPAHKYPNSPWEMIHPPGGDNAVCMQPHTVYTAECDKSLTATYQCKIPIPSNKLLVTNILTNKK